VPMESLRKDDKGYYVWKGKGQKVCQPDSVIADKFQIEKVYVKPGEYRAFINGPCKEYQALEDSGNLQEYDFILGKRVPDNLKSGETVLYRKYRYLFEPGDIVKVNIPDLVKPGFYVPASSVVQNATDDCYVYINNSGKAKKVNVRLAGGNDNYYRIEGNEIKNGVEVLSLDNNVSEIITDGARVNVNSVKYLFQEDEKKVVDVCAIKLNSLELPESEKSFYGTVRSLETAEIKFSSEEQICGNVTFTLPVNTPVFSKVTDKNGNIINKYFSRIASITRPSFERKVKIAKFQLKAAQAKVNNAKIKHDRYEKLGKTKSVSQKVYDASIKNYYSAVAEYYDLKAQLQTAQDTLDHCLITSVYTGLIDKIVAYPGDWTNPDMVLLNIKLMEPIGIDIKLNKSLARIVYKNYPKKIYPIGSAKSIGAFNEQDQLNEPRIPDWDYGKIDFEEVSEDQLYKTALTALLDNYTVQINKIDDEDKYPVIDLCWDSISYVSRFDPPIAGAASLAIPVESLREDNSGFYVWKCVGQKVYQPDTMIADKFQIRKVYVKPGVLKTYINGPSREYQVLETPGKLEEYDCVLGENIPDGLKDDDTVVYRKYKFMFNPGDVLKVEIPDLVKSGFYVPASSVILRSTDDGYVYINDNGKAKLIDIKLVGGNDKYFRIEGKNLRNGVEILVLDKEISNNIQDGSVINVKSATDLFSKKKLQTLNVSAIKLKTVEPKGIDKNIYGKIISVDEPVFAFSTRDRKCGQVASTLPVGANVMSRRTGKDGKMLDGYGVIAKIDSAIYEYNVNENEAFVKGAEARLSNAKIEYERNKNLYKKHAINKEKYDDALEAYENAKAECDIAKLKLISAKGSFSRCSATSLYSGVVKKIIVYPGSWSDHMYPFIQLDLMTPIGLKIEMNRKLALNTYKRYSKKVYPVGSDIPLGTLNEQDSLTETGIISLLDNYMVCINEIKNDEKYPVIEGYWGHPLYVSRFNVSLQNKIPLAVPVESLCKDDKGFFVWRGKGQKVCQPNLVIADKFQIEKIYVMPGGEKTYINGPCKEYQILEDPGKLQEYDFILGENSPKDLKDNDTVFYKKYKYLFNPGDIVKVEIPELLKAGYYIPISSVIQKTTDDCYVYINDNGKAKLTKVTLVGGNDDYYRIDGKDIKDETEVLILDEKTTGKITDGLPIKINSVTSAFSKENRSKIDISVMKLKTTELPDSEKTFYGTVKLLDTPSIKFSNWKERYARIATTLPVGFPVMAKVTDEDNKVLNADASTVATMETNSYDYILKSKEAEAENAENQYEIAQKILVVYEKLIKSHVVSQKDYDKIVENYYTAKADNAAAKAGVLIAKENVGACTRYSPCAGVIGKILAQPGTWSTRSWPILTIHLMSPMGLDIPINRILAGKILKTDPIKVYPSGANKPIGTFTQKNQISNTGITALIDNYMVSTNYRQAYSCCKRQDAQLESSTSKPILKGGSDQVFRSNANEYPIIEDYWNPTFYVFRFYSSINKKTPLAVPTKSLHKDNKGYYVWRGKGQKVCQPDSVIDDKFQIEKVYIVPGDLKTLVYGACTDYLLLKDSGSLQEYDFLLGEKIPKDLKDNSTVVYRKHSYLLKPGDKLKVEIPNLFKPGFYVPASSVTLKGSDSYVYINDKGKTKLVEVSITGGNDKYYRIEGSDISNGTEVILLDEKFPKDTADNCPVNVIAEIDPIIGNNTSLVNVSVLNLKETVPADTVFYGKIKASDSSDIKFTTYKHYQGYINSTLRPGAYRMSAVRDLKGNVVNGDDSIVASIDNSVYEYFIKSADANVAKAKAELDVAKIEFARYKKLLDAKAQSEENFIKALQNYESAKAGYATALSDRLIAVNDYKRCSVYTAYAGIVNRVNRLPGTWTGRDYAIVNLQIMTPAGIDIKMDRPIAELTMKNYPIKVYPVGSDVAVGTLETKDMLSETGLTSQLDNYFVPEIDIENKNNYPVIEGHIDEVFYVYRFYSPLEENRPLSVPLESLHKDDKGYFVWRAEGQKVFQPDSVIASEFKVTKIYVVPGDLKTYANGVCAKYRILKDPSKLEEYDVILGKKIPEDLKDGATVIYKKYKFLFEAGDTVKVEIPDLVKPGYYVPSKSVIQKGTDDSYVFINENGRAKLVKVMITGGCGGYYKIEGSNIKTGTDVIILDDIEIKDGMPVKRSN
jgi:multidrug resistance efflux pump